MSGENAVLSLEEFETHRRARRRHSGGTKCIVGRLQNNSSWLLDGDT